MANDHDDYPSERTSAAPNWWNRLKPRNQGLLIGIVLGLALVGVISLAALLFGRKEEPQYAWYERERTAPQYIYVYPTFPAPMTAPADLDSKVEPGTTNLPNAGTSPAANSPMPSAPCALPPATSAGTSPAANGDANEITEASPVANHPSRLWFDKEETGITNMAEVNRAIERGKNYLWGLQEPSGLWVSERDGRFTGGMTMLALFTLRTQGVSAGDPRLGKAVTALLAIPPEQHNSNYQRAMRILALLAMNPRKYNKYIQEDLAALAASQHKNGGWSYDTSDVTGHADKTPDNSNSQIAVLALFEAQRAGMVCPPETLRKTQNYWPLMQNPDGGFTYSAYSHSASYGSMTAAGLASMVLLADSLQSLRAGWSRDRFATPPTQALEWLNQQFATQAELDWLGQNDQRNGTIYYGLYAVERAGHAGGLKYLGGKDWFRLGCRQLVARQNPDGSWSGMTGTGRVIEPEVQTCFALLFLSKGLMPVAINKLKYEGDWNLTPRDLRQLTRWLSDTREHPLTWQMVEGGSASFGADVLDAPILYVTGIRPMTLSDADRQSITQFVRLGGTVLAVTGPPGGLPGGEGNGADSIFSGGFVRPTSTPGKVRIGPGGSIVSQEPPLSAPRTQPADFAEAIKALPTPTPPIWSQFAASAPAGEFAESVRRQLDDMLAPLGFERKPLPADHPLWNLIYPVPPMAGAEGWTDGVVWRAFLLPGEVGTDWDANVHKTKPISFQLATNLLVLATEGVGLGTRLKSNLSSVVLDLPMPAVTERPAPRWPMTVERPDAVVTLVRHAGGWRAGESAMGRLAELATQKLQINVGLQMGGDLDRQAANLWRSDIAPSPHILWISGTGDPKLSEDDWQSILMVGQCGGFIVFNAAASARPFSEAVLPELKRRFGEGNVVPLASVHPLLMGQGAYKGGQNLTKLGLRRPRSRVGQPISPLEPPKPAELYGLRLDGKLVGVFCPVDFTYGLAGGPTTDVTGYTHDGSRAIVLNLLIAARQKPELREKTD